MLNLKLHLLHCFNHIHCDWSRGRRDRSSVLWNVDYLAVGRYHAWFSCSEQCHCEGSVVEGVGFGRFDPGYSFDIHFVVGAAEIDCFGCFCYQCP